MILIQLEYLYLNYFEVSRGAGAQSVTVRFYSRWMWVRSSLEEMKYLFKFIFPFLRSGVGTKRGVEFRHSTRNAFKIRRKEENGVS